MNKNVKFGALVLALIYKYTTFLSLVSFWILTQCNKDLCYERQLLESQYPQLCLRVAAVDENTPWHLQRLQHDARQSQILLKLNSMPPAGELYGNYFVRNIIKCIKLKVYSLRFQSFFLSIKSTKENRLCGYDMVYDTAILSTHFP